MKEKLITLGLTEEMADKVVGGFGTVIDGLYVPKHELDTAKTEVKSLKETVAERDKTLKSLEQDVTDIADLKAKLAAAEADNKLKDKEKADALTAERKSNAIKLELKDKVHDLDMTSGLLKLDEIILNEDGTVKSGLKEQIDSLKTNKSFLFLEETNPEGDKGNQNTNNSNQNPFLPKGATPKDGQSKSPTNLTAGEQFAKQLAGNANQNSSNSANDYYFGEGGEK